MTSRSKLRRHVHVKGVSHVYYSERANGKRSYEVRHPEPNALFEVVGPRLDDAKARARAIYAADAPRVASVSTTLNEVVESWREQRHNRSRTVATYESNLRVHILPTLGRRKVRDLDKLAVQRWLTGLRRADGKGPLADGTRRLALATLFVVLGHTVDMGVIGAVPRIERKRKPKASTNRKRILTPDEEDRLIQYCGAFPWLKPIITVTLHQALRLGETLGLRWEDIRWGGKGKLRIERQLGKESIGPTKTGEARTIRLTAAAQEALRAVWEDQGYPTTGPVFLNSLGEQRSQRLTQRAFSKAVDRAGLREGHKDGPVVFHSLRHTGISRLANHPGIALVAVRDFAGHTDIAMTQKYVHNIESDAVDAAFDEAMAARA